MPSPLDYDAILERALQVMFPQEVEREAIVTRLATYGEEPFHRETSRVRLGILYLTSQSPALFEDHLSLARTDYRDLLCAAEYPHSSSHPSLAESDPEEYSRLKETDSAEYLAWIDRITWA